MNIKSRSTEELKKSNFRWVIVSLLFLLRQLIMLTAQYFLLQAGIIKKPDLDSVSMGYIFSAFGWSYVLAQLPGGCF